MSNENKVNNFEIKLDVSNFHADDLKVNVHERLLIVTGRHEEREEDGGRIERHFIRKYILPKNALEEEMTSELDASGTLKITVPIDAPSDYRKIPIKVDPNWKMQKPQCQELMIREPIPLWWW